MPVLEDEISRDELDAAVAEGRAQGAAEGRREGEAIGAAAAYSRISAILGDDRVSGKEALAIELACQSPSMSADQVVAFIARVPSAQVAPQSIRARVEATGVNAVAPGSDNPNPTGNPGPQDREREMAEMRSKSAKEAAAAVNASRGNRRVA